MIQPVEKIRIDKWLWAVRIYKTRSLATKACTEGKVKIADQAVKASRLITRGEIIQVRKNQINYQFEVIELTTRRFSSEIASGNYKDITPEDEKNKHKDSLPPVFYRPKGSGRPTKKERRDIDGMFNLNG